MRIPECNNEPHTVAISDMQSRQTIYYPCLFERKSLMLGNTLNMHHIYVLKKQDDNFNIKNIKNTPFIINNSNFQEMSVITPFSEDVSCSKFIHLASIFIKNYLIFLTHTNKALKCLYVWFVCPFVHAPTPANRNFMQLINLFRVP